MKIINFGSCNIDYVYSLHHIVSPGETDTTKGLEIFPGGKGLNQSIAAARAGAEAIHIGCLGTDGGLLLETLKESHVDTSYIKTVPGKCGHAIIQLAADGENSIFLYPGANYFEKTEKGTHCFVIRKYASEYYKTKINSLIESKCL